MIDDPTFFAAPVNAALRRRARECYRDNAGSFILAVIFAFLLTGLLPVLVPALGSSTLGMVWQAVLYPITTVGLYVMSLGALHGETPQATQLFDFCRAPNRWALAFLAGLLSDGIFLAASSGSFLGAYFVNLEESSISLPLLLCLVLVSVVLLVLVSIRLAPLPYILASGRALDPVHALRLTWRKTKGHFFSILWFQIALMLPPILLMSLIVAVVGAVAGSTVSTILSALFSALLNPYYVLAQAQFFACFFTPAGTDTAAASPVGEDVPDTFLGESDR